MFMIVTSHYTHALTGELPSNIVNEIFFKIFTSFGQVGVGIFLLIASYYMINSDHRIEKLGKLHLQVLFWSITICCIFIFTGSDISFRLILKSFFPTVFVNYWYFTAYAILFAVAPYIDLIINKLNREEFRLFLVLLISIFSIIRLIPGAFDDSKVSGVVIGHLIPCFLIYFLAGYVKRFREPTDNLGGILMEGCVGNYDSLSYHNCYDNYRNNVAFSESYR